MRILQVHNFYRSEFPSGEGIVVHAERKLLSEAGHTVIPWDISNDTIATMSLPKKIRSALETPWSVDSYRQFKRMLAAEQPDVVHVHSTFPLISPSVFWACRHSGVGSVVTLHNYRIACANGLLFRDNKPCEACIGKPPTAAIRYGCYRDSPLLTLPVAANISLNRRLGTFSRVVDRIITMTRFGRDKAIEMGVPGQRIRIKPHFLAKDLGNVPPPEERHGALFIGRLSVAKGIRVLSQAWRELDYPLTVLGHGDERDVFADASNAVTLRGKVPHEEVIAELKRAAFLIVPSIWYETFGLIIMEAFACGTPVIVSDIGAIAEAVDHGVNGLRFRPNDADDLRAKVTGLASDPDSRAEMSRAARETFERRYLPQTNLDRMRQIYGEAQQEARSR